MNKPSHSGNSFEANSSVSRRYFLKKTALLGLTAVVPAAVMNLGTAEAAAAATASEIPTAKIQGRKRARDLGIRIGRMTPGKWNAITDVPGVKVGYSTIIEGDGPLVVGKGPIRTGVTVILPHDGDLKSDPIYAGFHSFNGNGEMTGIHWVKESGLLTSPVAITNTHSVGVVRDALIAYDVNHERIESGWALPVVAETWDGRLNDLNGFHVKPEHVFEALDSAKNGPIQEGNVGGGTAMNCHGFKGGTGTASRVLSKEQGGYTVGVLVQTNYGSRELLRVNGVPVGLEISTDEVPGVGIPKSAPKTASIEDIGSTLEPGSGSIIIIVATNAPLLPGQCDRLAQRATVGLARMGGTGSNGSGDIFLAFTTGNRGMEAEGASPKTVGTLSSGSMSVLFEAVAEATEEAILNSMCMATTMVGINGVTSNELPLDRLVQVMKKYNRM
ncbi:P1 family peptidase [Brevibacillus sp. NRS-1366]|uniref:DmpA family aminopeptidase n=1 Tax=Brevibacillus sp. NRS-1366 TaxID=3233899 RepID=UPI003D1FE68E